MPQLINETADVRLKRWQWLFLLGWCEAHRREDESVYLTDVFAELGKQVSINE